MKYLTLIYLFKIHLKLFLIGELFQTQFCIYSGKLKNWSLNLKNIMIWIHQDLNMFIWVHGIFLNIHQLFTKFQTNLILRKAIMHHFMKYMSKRWSPKLEMLSRFDIKHNSMLIIRKSKESKNMENIEIKEVQIHHQVQSQRTMMTQINIKMKFLKCFGMNSYW